MLNAFREHLIKMRSSSGPDAIGHYRRSALRHGRSVILATRRWYVRRLAGSVPASASAVLKKSMRLDSSPLIDRTQLSGALSSSASYTERLEMTMQDRM
jgi:hypothetical protein